jgi:hypothetical protein
MSKKSGYKISVVTALAAASRGSELASSLDGITFGWPEMLWINLELFQLQDLDNHNNTAGITTAHVPSCMRKATFPGSFSTQLKYF